MDRAAQLLHDRIADPLLANPELDDEAEEQEDLEDTRSDDERHSMIAEAAYYRALERGFETGFELDDWLQAEAEIEARSSPR